MTDEIGHEAEDVGADDLLLLGLICLHELFAHKDLHDLIAVSGAFIVGGTLGLLIRVNMHLRLIGTIPHVGCGHRHWVLTHLWTSILLSVIVLVASSIVAGHLLRLNLVTTHLPLWSWCRIHYLLSAKAILLPISKMMLVTIVAVGHSCLLALVTTRIEVIHSIIVVILHRIVRSSFLLKLTHE